MGSEISSPDRATMPRELLALPPRKTRIKGAGVFFGATGAAMVLIGGILFLRYFYAGAEELVRALELRHGGHEAAAVVTRLWSRERYWHMVSYAFAGDDRVVWTGESSAPTDRWYNLHEGDHLPIRFLPAHPGTNHPAAWEWPVWDVWLRCAVITPVIVLGIGLVMRTRWDRRLAAEGLPIAAVVVSYSRGSKGGLFAKYQFQTKDGRAADGSWGCDSRPEIGSTVWVVYLPQNPDANRAYSDLGYRAVG